MSNILYNKTFESDSKNIDLIINFFEDYKTHLRKKNFWCLNILFQKLWNL